MCVHKEIIVTRIMLGIHVLCLTLLYTLITKDALRVLNMLQSWDQMKKLVVMKTV